MAKMTMGVIGYGKMGSSIIKGALNAKLMPPRHVRVFDPDSARRQLAEEDGLTCTDSLESLIGTDALLLAVKPKDAAAVLDELGRLVVPGKSLIVSIVAGLKLATIESKLGDGSRIIRVMPNLPASVNEAASVLVPNKWALATDIAFVESLLNRIGLSFRLENESLIDAVTGISGSGPAYFFLLMKALEGVGKKMGLPDELTKSLIAQTGKGAGSLVLQTDLSFEQLIGAVASPGGTTEEALKVMESNGFSKIVIDAVTAAIEKSKRMSHA